MDLKLAGLTPEHSLAWDVGTGNGQAASKLSEHYEQVVGSDISGEQLKHAIQHPRIRYIHTPASISEDEMVNLIAGGHENSVDLVTVAEAVHWFDLPHFYSLVRRLLRKPGGVIAVWGYNDMVVSPDFDLLMKRHHEKMLPYYDPKSSYLWEGYRTLPFPFESVGLGREGEPMALEIHKELSFQGLLKLLRSSSAVTTAKDKGVDLLSEEVIEEIQGVWGRPDLVRSVTYKAFMLAGKL
ncbi:putative methyltransferase DDB_G0268948 [Rosa chinensis]|uniref:putative methyltransferase DDB_G0268948 n=1 Tax=Rosa chinensis TaxID=74649 RepID=UPI001AD93F61|nr:putative methyltransferase DDB_G0268948 [Rosa chinensis]XP_040367926.1 putative methyltransferase DDB_G0268948 [Rosa chinensis]